MLRTVFALWLCLVGVAFAQSAQLNDVSKNPFTEGKEYKVLPEGTASTPTAKASLESNKGKVEVLAFFSYGCPVCNRMEPEVEKWYQSKKDTQMVAFVDVPMDWQHQGWENLARAYFIAEELGVTDKAHPALFRAVHQQGKNFKNKADLEAFFLSLGVPRQKFNDTFDSFNVRRRMKQAELLRNDYGIKSIPAFVVNGEYYVDVQSAGSINNTIAVLDYLVNKEAFMEGSEEIQFDEVSEGIDNKGNETLMIEQGTETVAPSVAP